MPDTDSDKRPALGLSLSQVVGGSLAAATAALLGSKLGTTGTIVGAALVSIISAVGGALYTASLRRTREVVVRTREILPTGQWRTVAMPQVPDQPDGSESDVAEVDDDGPRDADVEQDRRPIWTWISWKPVAAVAAVVFVAAAALVTGAELATGHDATVVKVVHPRSTPTPSPTPSQQPTKTATSSTPSASTSATASATPTESASPTASPSASSSPTESPSASASPSASPTP